MLNCSVTTRMVNQGSVSIPNTNIPISNMSGKVIQLTNDQSQTSTKADVPISKKLSYGWILAILWLVGVLLLALLSLATNFRFYSLVRREPLATDAEMTNLMQECARKLGIRKSLPIICMNGIDTPCLYGIVSPKLLLPKSLVNRLNNENMRHIFIHELSHYKRNDILINWLAVAAQIVHWFNPLIWYSFARMREDCELACDADTLSYLRPEEYQSYGLSIISLVTPAQSTWLSGTTGFFGNKNNLQIRKRIKMIKLFHKPTLKWSWTAVVIFISLGLVGFTNSISNGTPATGVGTTLSTVEQVKPNQVVRDAWNLTITKTTLGNLDNDQTKKVAGVYITFTNSNGADKAFSPKGKITGVVGSSGKFYEINWLDSLDTMNTKGQRASQMVAQQEGKLYEPGVFKFNTQLYVDSGEQYLTKVLYQDENGNKLEVPIQGDPEVTSNAIPAQMKPGTVIEYDKNIKMILVFDGFKDKDGKEVVYKNATSKATSNEVRLPSPQAGMKVYYDGLGEPMKITINGVIDMLW